MIVSFDTSILVAGLIQCHPQHNFAKKWLEQAIDKKIELHIASHALAECYSVLTSLPIKPKISPVIAVNLIKENIEKNAKIISLSLNDYLDVIKKMSALSLSGGMVYDGIILKAAQKAKAEKIVTLNSKHFLLINPENDPEILGIES